MPSASDPCRVLVLASSDTGNTLKMARQVARGVNSVDGAVAELRAIAPIALASEPAADELAESGAPWVSPEDLAAADALALGSPAWYGQPTAAVKHFLDQSTPLWLNGTLQGKPAGVFCSAGDLHGGHEACLLAMIVPLLHHGMLISGLPYDSELLSQTRGGGTPYGPSHFAGADGRRALDEIESALCQRLGERLARLALQLKGAKL